VIPRHGQYNGAGATEESLALASRLGTRFGLPCQKAFPAARLLQGWGDTGKAKEHLVRACRLFRHLGMAWGLAQAEQALK
jgi:hypothetical protein